MWWFSYPELQRNKRMVNKALNFTSRDDNENSKGTKGKGT
jgi:hypothetical protein